MTEQQLRLIASVLNYEKATLRDGNATLWADNVREAAKIVDDAIRAPVPEVDALDAARYRWLRDLSVPPHNFYIAVPIEFKDERYTARQVDAAIDAALGAASSPQKTIYSSTHGEGHTGGPGGHEERVTIKGSDMNGDRQ